MWGLLSAYSSYVKVGFYALVICGIFFAGWHTRDRDFSVYKMEQQAAVEKQQTEIESTKKQHELVTKGIQDEYDAKLTLLRQYYANGVRSNGTSPVSGISTTSSIANATAAYNQLAEQCAETTLQLVELQKWINEQVGIK